MAIRATGLERGLDAKEVKPKPVQAPEPVREPQVRGDGLTAQQRWRRKNRAKLADYQRRYRARRRDERV